jgi:hypothetical protein
LIVCVGTLWSLLNRYRFPKTPQSSSSDTLASAGGWKISHSHGNKKVYQASIESFSVERAKLGPFAIGPLQIARFKKVVIDFYAEGLLSYAGADQAPSKMGTFGIDALEGPLADIKNDLLFRSRRIGILDIMGISLNLWERDKKVFEVSSDRATFDRQTGDIIFTGHATLDAAENGIIISYRIRWIKKTSLFRIKDPFIFTKGNEKREGRELETDYRLKKINMPDPKRSDASNQNIKR